ncbi:MAG TPA: cyclase family protein, partial [Pirellulaceae bacterium]
MTASTLDSAIALPEIVFSAGAARWKIRVSDAVSLAVSMDFERRQPSLFGVPLARCGPLRVGSFIGSVSQGGSCNVDVVQALIPHCQGTHTESVGHIVSEAVAIGRVCLSPLLLAQVVSVTPMSSGTHVDSYRPPIEADDRVISAKSLNAAMTALPTWSTGDESPRISALIVRTLPNSEQKRHTVYAVTDCVPYFSVEAMDRIDELGFDHLLTDLPSIDRLNDSGWLT